MLCPKCGGKWETILFKGKHINACSKCGYIDKRTIACINVTTREREDLTAPLDFPDYIEKLPPIARFFASLGW